MLVLGIFSLMTAVALPNVKISPILLTRVASIVLLYAAALSYNALNIQAIGSGVSIYSGLFQVTSVTQSIDTFIFIVGALILLPWAPISNAVMSQARGVFTAVPTIAEYPLIILFSVCGSSFLVSSADLVSVYLSIELQSFAVYILATLYRDSESATSAGLKYFLLEVCLQRRFRRVARHEGAKHIMGRALASTLGTRVRLEPLGHQTSRRNDIQVFSLLGSQATGLANAEYDLTVVSLANKEARATRLPNQDTDPSRLANKYLDSVADHKVRHRPTSNLPFHPIVLSLGGMMNGSTTKVFTSWKRVMTRGTYNLMLKRLSLCLLQARVRSFEL
jgi:hypothetical protein